MLRSRTRVRGGSSPRVRGKRMGVGGGEELGGLIPACAGKTLARTLVQPSGQAHPRVCGENRLGDSCRMWGVGSSPRVRGKRVPRLFVLWFSRLIPACAGKTKTSRRIPRHPRAHPRVCGENRAAVARALAVAGSSPRVRGKRLGVRGNTHKPGLIPACAGKTSVLRSAMRSAPAHPRVCGENAHDEHHRLWQEGSSPRVRGKRWWAI